MATRTSLKRTLRRVAGALTEFARDRGWGRDDYWMYYWYNSTWDKLHILFVARGFEEQGGFPIYAAVRNHLVTKLADEPELIDKLGLVVLSKKQVEGGGIYSIGDEYRELRATSRPNPSSPGGP